MSEQVITKKKNPLLQKAFQVYKNFPGSIATLLPWFFCLFLPQPPPLPKPIWLPHLPNIFASWFLLFVFFLFLLFLSPLWLALLDLWLCFEWDPPLLLVLPANLFFFFFGFCLIQGRDIGFICFGKFSSGPIIGSTFNSVISFSIVLHW